MVSWQCLGEFCSLDRQFPPIFVLPRALRGTRTRGCPWNSTRAAISTRVTRSRRPPGAQVPSSTSSSSTPPPANSLDEETTPTNQRYVFRRNRQPRYKPATCGLRNCVCVNNIESAVPSVMARGDHPRTAQYRQNRPNHAHAIKSKR